MERNFEIVRQHDKYYRTKLLFPALGFYPGKVSLDDVKFGFYHFVLSVLAALAIPRDGLFNNNAQSLELANAFQGVITNLT
jgi:hypothetical protein